MSLKNVKAFMIDLDGVVYLGNKPVNGAADAINFLSRKYRCIFVSNTTRTSISGLAQKLGSFGIKTKEADIITALSATIDYIISSKKGAGCYLLCSSDAKEEFASSGLKLDDKNPDFVVVGLDKDLSFKTLNKAFSFIMNGAKFVAMHADRSAPMEDGLCLSVGPFAKALEYATGKKAVYIGKPNKEFFRAALEKLKTRPEETAMIGDTMEIDIVGAKSIGMKGILIGNGREVGKIKPDLVIDSISELPEALK